MIDTTGMNTSSVLECAKDYAIEHGIKNIVIATTRGDTALRASEIFGNDQRITAVTHSTGFIEDNHQEMEKKIRIELEKKGIRVLTTVMPFHCWSDHYRKTRNMIMPSTVIADTLRLFGQGTKVCVEIVMMAGDAGLIPQDEPVISVAGTGRGADTVLLIKGCNTRRFFDTRIMDVIAKPRDW